MDWRGDPRESLRQPRLGVSSASARPGALIRGDAIRSAHSMSCAALVDEEQVTQIAVRAEPAQTPAAHHFGPRGRTGTRTCAIHADELRHDDAGRPLRDLRAIVEGAGGWQFRSGICASGSMRTPELSASDVSTLVGIAAMVI